MGTPQTTLNAAGDVEARAQPLNAATWDLDRWVSSFQGHSPLNMRVDRTSLDVQGTGLATAMGVGTDGATLANPKNTSIARLSLKTVNPETGLPVELEIEGLDTSASEVIEATTPQIQEAIAYGSQLSEDQREAYVETLKTLSPTIGSAVEAAFRVFAGGGP